jgi:DNA-binding MarR family transcriptional regulator
VTTTQLAILRSLNRMGPSPLSRLADALVMDRTSLYRTIKPMVEAHWVSIKADKKGRSKTATLTAPGRKAMDRAGPYWDQAQARLIGALGEGAWLSLHQELSGVITVATKIFQHNIFDRP